MFAFFYLSKNHIKKVLLSKQNEKKITEDRLLNQILVAYFKCKLFIVLTHSSVSNNRIFGSRKTLKEIFYRTFL